MLRKIYKLLNKKQSYQLNLILFLYLFTFLFEFISLASLPIFISSLIDQESLIKITKNYINYDLSTFSSNEIVKYCGLFVLIIFISKNIFFLFLTSYQAKYFENIKKNLSEKFFKYYINLPYEFFLNENPALISRTIITELQGVAGYVSYLTLLFKECFAIFAIVIILFLVNPKNVILLTIFFIFFSYLYLYFIKPKLKFASEENQLLQGKNIKMVIETFGSIKDIKVSENETNVFEKFKKNIKEYEKNLKFIYITEKLPKIFLEASSILLVVLITFFLFGDMRKELVFSNLAILVIFIIRFIPAFGGITVSLTYLKIWRASLNLVLREFEKLKKNLNIPHLRKNYIPQKKINKNDKTFISIDDLSFKYHQGKNTTFKNLKFTINQGDKVAIIGKTGSGKSTLIYLLLGLIKPYEGNIFYKNKNIDENISDWRKRLSYVSQNNYLYDASIKENITLSSINLRDSFNEKKFNDVLKDALLYDKINNLENGVDSNVGNDGAKLSGGEKQRLCIARALYRNKDLLLMDEFTSALDSSTENKILENIMKNYSECTLIIATHRQNTIDKCNKIIDIDKYK